MLLLRHTEKDTFIITAPAPTRPGHWDALVYWDRQALVHTLKRCNWTSTDLSHSRVVRMAFGPQASVSFQQPEIEYQRTSWLEILLKTGWAQPALLHKLAETAQLHCGCSPKQLSKHPHLPPSSPPKAGMPGYFPRHNRDQF